MRQHVWRREAPLIGILDSCVIRNSPLAFVLTGNVRGMSGVELRPAKRVNPGWELNLAHLSHADSQQRL
jgi:hypothetical protein